MKHEGAGDGARACMPLSRAVRREQEKRSLQHTSATHQQGESTTQVGSWATQLQAHHTCPRRLLAVPGQLPHTATPFSPLHPHTCLH